MTDTNRLARANQFRLNYQPRHSVGDERTNAMLADFATAEVKAAVEAERERMCQRLNIMLIEGDYDGLLEWFDKEFAQELQPKEEQDA